MQRLWCTLQLSTALIFLLQQTKGPRITEDCMSNVVFMIFSNDLFWMVVWCFGRHAEMFRGSGSNKKCHHAAVINFSSSAAAPKSTMQYIIVRSNPQFRVSRLKRSMRSGRVLELAEMGLALKNL